MSDELLIVLSKRGEVTWPTFRGYIEELTPSGVESPANVLLNVLQSLGHVVSDFAEGRGVIQIAPRVLARLPAVGRPRAVLVGHRLAATEEELKNACVSLPTAFPSCIGIRCACCGPCWVAAVPW